MTTHQDRPVPRAGAVPPGEAEDEDDLTFIVQAAPAAPPVDIDTDIVPLSGAWACLQIPAWVQPVA